jgi:histone acetyltransferase (RNA polymerase elongator complex component)
MEYEIASIEDIHQKYVRHRATTPNFKKAVTEDDVRRWSGFVRQLAEADTGMGVTKPKSIPNSFFLKLARLLHQRGELTGTEVQRVEAAMQVVKGKSHSGVLVITVFTSPTPTYDDPVTGERVIQKFSCQWNCYYCPNQPGQPRSYLEGEPGVLRANQYGFDCREQMTGRMEDLYNAGHVVDKLEVLILGGTWESYPEAYRTDFIRDIYYAANTFGEEERRPAETMEAERDLNRDARTRVIGITIETRPDTVTPVALATLRRYGCTRVQIGIQHLDDGVLKKINRRCTRDQVIRAIALLKDWGFKIDGHFMPNLPGATPALDRWMLMEQLLARNETRMVETHGIRGVQRWERWAMTHTELQIDQWKVYPCETTPYTVIEKWYREGSYMPYPESELVPVLLEMKAAMVPWIRLNRIVRDIPADYIMASGDRPNLRQELLGALARRGQRCACIRCREVKQQGFVAEEAMVIVREYEGSKGTEYFIACEHVTKPILYGFVRLRIPDPKSGVAVHPTFIDHAWIRELHVYGRLQATHRAMNHTHATQHRGIGKTLMGIAEQIAFDTYGRQKLLVIAGEGTKRYYEGLGYTETHHGYMWKVRESRMDER